MMKKIKIKKGFSLAVRDEGKPGKGTILLLHSLGLSHKIFEPQIEYFSARGWRVIAPDTRGHGDSDKPDEEVTLEDIADDFLNLLDELGIKQLDLLGGLSMGGMYAMRMVLARPDVARKLLLMGTSADEDPNRETYMPVVRQMIETERKQPPEKKQKAYRNYAELVVRLCFTPEYLEKNNNFERWVEIALKSQGISSVWVAKAVLTRPSILDKISNIKIPTLILVGERDNLLPVSESQKMAERIPNSKLVVVPQAGHVFTVEKPEFVNEQIEKFLAE